MGNKCPSGFQNNPTNPVACVPECPRQKGFDIAVQGGVPACVYRSRPTVFFTLKSVSALDDKTFAQYPTVQSLPAGSPAKANYLAAIEAYNADSAIALQKVAKETQLADAFKDLQLAENIRDKSPQAYQDARIRYYTLLNGDKWIDEERARVTQSEVAPKVASYMASYQDMTTRQTQQQRTIDVVKAVKDKVVSMKDDFKTTTNVFAKQIGELKSQIEIEKRRSLEEKQASTNWAHLVVNVLLVVFAIAAILVIVRKLIANESTSAYTRTPGVQ